MLACIIIVSLAYTWLLWETRWLTIRLPVGLDFYGASCPIPIATWLSVLACYSPHNVTLFIAKPENHNPLNVWNPRQAITIADYVSELSPGIRCNKNQFLCGDWLKENLHNLDDYNPTVELDFGNGYHQTFTLKRPGLIRQIVKINTGKRYFKQLMAKA